MTEHIESEHDDDEESAEQALCPQCMTDNVPNSPFCSKCGAPLTSYAATGPFERLFAEGYVYRRAAEHPNGLIVVLGMWLIFGSAAIAGISVTIISWQMGDTFSVFPGILLTIFSAVLVGKTTKNYLKRRMLRSTENE
jgi:hypothetical protein